MCHSGRTCSVDDFLELLAVAAVVVMVVAVQLDIHPLLPASVHQSRYPPPCRLDPRRPDRLSRTFHWLPSLSVCVAAWRV